MQLRLAPRNWFKPSSKIVLLTVRRRSFVDHLCYLSLVFVMISRLFIAAMWPPAGLRCLIVFLSLSHVVLNCIDS